MSSLDVTPYVTIVVVPRERFQFAQESLESLYDNTSCSFKLIYVDNNSPAKLRVYLQTAAEKYGFQLLHSDRFLSPNQARNFGLSQVDSKYVVFVDNDVIFAPNWLQALVDCTEDTGATVVGSLVCQYRPAHTIIHCAGGDYMEAEDYAKFIQGEPTVAPEAGVPGKWQINEKTYFQNRKVEDVREHLKRQPIGFVEFHAMLVRTEIFDQIGLLDEGFSCTKEYLDFCMTVVQAGGTVYLEPPSVVTFLTHPPAPVLQWADLPYFMVRWSDNWERDSLIHFQKKWDLVENKYFQKRLKKLGWRRREEMIQPIVERFSFLNSAGRKWLEKRLVALEKRLNRYLSQQHARMLETDKEQQLHPLYLRKTMLYRPFGTTGLHLSAIGMGTWNIGNQWGEVEESTALNTLRAAVESGINLFDTAESYGIPAGLSEERLGKALKGVRDQVHIATKIGRWGRRSGQTVPMTTVDMVRLCTHASLYRLKTDYIDLMLCHEGKIENPSVYLEGFELLQQQGYIRSFGISTDKLKVLKGFNANNSCRVVEVDYSLLNRKPEAEFFPYCQEHNIAVLVRGPLHKGLLSGKYSPDTVFTDTVRSEWYLDETSSSKLAANFAKVERLKQTIQPGEDLITAALRFAISHPVQPVAIPGAKSPEQVAMNAKAGEQVMTEIERERLIGYMQTDQTSTAINQNEAEQLVLTAAK